MRKREEEEEGYQGKTKRKVKLWKQGRQVEKMTGKEERKREKEEQGSAGKGFRREKIRRKKERIGRETEGGRMLPRETGRKVKLLEKGTTGRAGVKDRR